MRRRQPWQPPSTRTAWRRRCWTLGGPPHSRRSLSDCPAAASAPSCIDSAASARGTALVLDPGPGLVLALVRVRARAQVLVPRSWPLRSAPKAVGPCVTGVARLWCFAAIEGPSRRWPSRRTMVCFSRGASMARCGCGTWRLGAACARCRHTSCLSGAWLGVRLASSLPAVARGGWRLYGPCTARYQLQCSATVLWRPMSSPLPSTPTAATLPPAARTPLFGCTRSLVAPRSPSSRTTSRLSPRWRLDLTVCTWQLASREGA
mmetsp:Transcript_2750/g.8284  ORF Transcript_2750/g.8284 Transcript_2750/m.8284 type:complete len:262 (+) Transcript_2750:356-1141(+)